MDNELRLIQYLYGEDERPEDLERLLEADESLQAEYRQLHAVKEQLDARPRQRPDTAVVDEIVDAAARASQPEPSSRRAERPRKDREPAMLQRMPWQRVLRVAAAFAVLVVGVGIGVWQYGGALGPSVSGEAATSSSPTADARSSAPPPTAEEASIPEWDEADDVVRLHRHIETLQARSSPTSWDYPGAELQTASQLSGPSN